MATTPAVSRRQLGTELRKLRREAGYTQGDVAARIRIAVSTLSRIETGKAPVKPGHLDQMLSMYGVTDPGKTKILADMARAGHGRDWWAAYGSDLPGGFDIYIGLEAETSAFRSYEASVVHGLLQTADYARAVLTAMFPRRTAEQVERLVNLRMTRQRRLHDDPPPDLWVILDETAIRRTVGGPVCMRRQLEHLLTKAHRNEVTLQVLPFAAGAHPGNGGSFSILEFPGRDNRRVAYVECAAGSIYLQRPRDVEHLADAFDRLLAAALSPARTRDLLEEAADQILASSAAFPHPGPTASGRG